MKQLAAALAIVLALPGLSAGQAAPPKTPSMTSQMTSGERDYVAVRDAAIAKIKARVDAEQKIDDTLSAEDTKALADLETRLRAIVGVVDVAGFGRAEKSNLETLLPEMGFGQLDGLVASTPDAKSSVIVTTVPLFVNWLRSHKDWWGKKFAPMPQAIDAVVRTEAFYTQATPQGAAMVAYGTLKVTKPDGATHASAVLAARTQDQSPDAPDQMFAVLVKGGRVFVANVPLAQAITPDPSCAALRTAFHQRAEKAFDAYRAGGLKDTKMTDRASALEKEGDEKQRRCVGEKMTAEQKAGAVKQAQVVIDAMAGK